MSIICIDNGHGGSDPGAKGKGMTEAKINYNVGQKLKTLLEADGHTVIMTRNQHEYVNLARRSQIANAAKVDLFISIHHNAGGGDGFEIIYKMNCYKSLKFAKNVETEFKKLNNERKIYCKPGIINPKKDYYAVLRDTKAPAIITEFAFLDSIDVEAVDTLAEQWREAEAIYTAVKSYLKN
jgi:N-acetylmuramoyl-L-alanine amidase